MLLPLLLIKDKDKICKEMSTSQTIIKSNMVKAENKVDSNKNVKFHFQIKLKNAKRLIKKNVEVKFDFYRGFLEFLYVRVKVEPAIVVS